MTLNPTGDMIAVLRLILDDNRPGLCAYVNGLTEREMVALVVTCGVNIVELIRDTASETGVSADGLLQAIAERAMRMSA